MLFKAAAKRRTTEKEKAEAVASMARKVEDLEKFLDDLLLLRPDLKFFRKPDPEWHIRGFFDFRPRPDVWDIAGVRETVELLDEFTRPDSGQQLLHERMRRLAEYLGE